MLGEDARLDPKWRLVWELVNEGAGGRDLRGADLAGANLTGANLDGADFTDADLRGADLTEASLIGADLTAAMLDEDTQLEGKSQLVWEINSQGAAGRNLAGADLAGARLARI